METEAPSLTLKSVVEALVFASPKPMPAKEIVGALKSAGKDTEDPLALELAKLKEADVITALTEIQAEILATGRAFHLVEQVNGWTLVSDPRAARWVRQLYPEAKPTKLTGPQLETLAIIAYRQPVTRADIEAVRGVAVDGVMQVLLDRSLVKIAGRAEVPGRPLLYETTQYFLQHFGLRNTNELPNADELKRVPLPTAPPAAESGTTAVEETTPAAEASAPASESSPPSDGGTPESTPEAPEPTPAEEPAPAAEAATEPEPEPDLEPKGEE